MILEIFKVWNQIAVEGCLTFPINVQWFRVLVLVPCLAATNHCRLIHRITLEHRKTFFGSKFSTFDSPRDYSKRIQPDDVQRNREAVLEARRTKTTQTSEDRRKSRHNFNADICNKAVDYEFYNTVELWSDSKNSKKPKRNSTNSQSTIVFVLEDMIQESSECLFWFAIGRYEINQRVEMVGSLEELKSSPRCWTRKLPLLWTRSSIIPKSRRRSASRNRKPRKRTDFYEENRLIYDYFRMTGVHDTPLDSVDKFSVALHDDNVQDFDTRWDEVLLSVSKFPSEDVLESLYKLTIRHSDQLKTVLELYDMEIHQKIPVPNYQKLKTMVRRRID